MSCDSSIVTSCCCYVVRGDDVVSRNWWHVDVHDALRNSTSMMPCNHGDDGNDHHSERNGWLASLLDVAYDWIQLLLLGFCCMQPSCSCWLDSWSYCGVVAACWSMMMRLLAFPSSYYWNDGQPRRCCYVSWMMSYTYPAPALYASRGMNADDGGHQQHDACCLSSCSSFLVFYYSSDVC